MKDPRGTIEYNVKFIKIAADGFLALPKSGGELLDKREYTNDENVVLFEIEAVKEIINDLSNEILKAANSL